MLSSDDTLQSAIIAPTCACFNSFLYTYAQAPIWSPFSFTPTHSYGVADRPCALVIGTRTPPTSITSAAGVRRTYPASAAARPNVAGNHSPMVPSPCWCSRNLMRFQ
ncbi:MAG: hypothetical protein DMG04_30620 [Acidobacteria bacterium]|nr:MAG: hypothetical protein DMG04_30620 [Acidobacteriota bacterium]PYQ80758.1 MAG: hypothetical protein DMG03_21785 [Acidobacteriota bacterium]PYQ91190.1 MAG: hypothetical protein DMG02_06495 [Acidobacteriota bacterium]PYR08366.1 MAG: hypothetical protein DMF99_19605 [Acidobacteriota bacterium]